MMTKPGWISDSVEKHIKHLEALFDNIGAAFVWADTLEGQNYWAEVNMKLYRMLDAAREYRDTPKTQTVLDSDIREGVSAESAAYAWLHARADWDADVGDICRTILNMLATASSARG